MSSTTAAATAIAQQVISRDRVAAQLPTCVAEAAPLDRLVVFAVPDDASDTAAFSERFGFGLEDCANTLIVKFKKAGGEHYAALVSLGSRRVDVNGAVKAALGAQRLSFAKREDATERTGMAFGGITAYGLPADWPVLVDAAVMTREQVVMGAGVREAKLLLDPQLLASLPNVTVLPLTLDEPAATPAVSPPL